MFWGWKQAIWRWTIQTLGQHANATEKDPLKIWELNPGPWGYSVNHSSTVYHLRFTAWCDGETTSCFISKILPKKLNLKEFVQSCCWLYTGKIIVVKGFKFKFSWFKKRVCIKSVVTVEPVRAAASSEKSWFLMHCGRFSRSAFRAEGMAIANPWGNCEYVSPSTTAADKSAFDLSFACKAARHNTEVVLGTCSH